MTSTAVTQWHEFLRGAIAAGNLIRVSLGGYSRRDQSIRKLLIRPILLKQVPMLTFVWRHTTRDITRNYSPEEGLGMIQDLLGHDFLAATLFTTERTVEIQFRKGSEPRLRILAPESTELPSLSHDRTKHRVLPSEVRPWMQTLGVTTESGAVKAGMESKLRQIHRFVELLEHLVKEAGNQLRADGTTPLTLLDMGSGKGYLTFAAYEYLQRTFGTNIRARGVEVRRELVDTCNQAAADSGYENLRFSMGTIESCPVERADIVVALHACDTATDDALARGIEAGAALIIAAPCCHKEIRPQLKAPPELADALRHGILRERHAEFVTDAMRSALLEWAGYDTRVFEFIAPEHTSKNLMIAAVRRPNPGDRRPAEASVSALAKAYGIERQRLASLLKFRF